MKNNITSKNGIIRVSAGLIVLIVFVYALFQTVAGTGNTKNGQTVKTVDQKPFFGKDKVKIEAEPADMSYILQNTAGGAYDNHSNIYTVDFKSCEIQKFAWENGEWRRVNKIGGRGAGPGEFMLLPNIICINDSRKEGNGATLIAYDFKKRRLFLYDSDLKPLPTPEHKPIGLFRTFCGNDQNILGNCMGENERLVLFNWHNGNVKEIEISDREFIAPFKKYQNINPMFRIYFCKVYAANPKTGEFIVTYLSPDGTVPLFFLDKEGNLKRKINVNVSNDYHFPEKLLANLGSYKDTRYIYIDSIQYINDKVSLVHFVEELGGHLDSQKEFMLVVDNVSGDVIRRQEIDKNCKILNHESQGEKVYVMYKNFRDEDIHFAPISEGIIPARYLTN